MDNVLINIISLTKENKAGGLKKWKNTDVKFADIFMTRK